MHSHVVQYGDLLLDRFYVFCSHSNHEISLQQMYSCSL